MGAVIGPLVAGYFSATAQCARAPRTNYCKKMQ